jgi:O-antigen/teichoic acid export membrane protein
MKKYFRSSEYTKNSFISVMGVGMAAVIPVLLQPFLGRMFTPEEFNVLGLYVTLTSVLAIAANFRYGYAVAVSHDDESAKNLLAGSIFLSFVFSMLTLAGMFFFSGAIRSGLSLSPQFYNSLYLVPLSVFFISSCIALNGWLNRKKQFLAMAVNKTVRRGGEGFFQLVLGWKKVQGGLIYGTFIGDAINFGVHAFQFRKSGGNFRQVTAPTIRKNLVRYSDYPKFNLIPSLLDTLSLYLPFLVVNLLYSESVSGQFYKSRELLALPLILISTALSQVLLQKLTEKRLNREPVTAILAKHFYLLGAMGIFGALIVYPFGREIFMIFLGDQWGPAGEMSSLMVVAYAIKFAVTPLTVVFFSLEKIRVSSLWQVGYFVGISLLFFVREVPIGTFIFYYVVIEVVFYLVYLLLVFRVAKRYDFGLGR